MASASGATKKKFATCNLNQVLGAPKEAVPKNSGPAVRSAAVIKPVAKPKGLISLGRAPPGSNIHTRKGAAWSHLEEKAKERREEEDARKDDLSKPEWAVLDFEDLDKPLSKPDTVDSVNLKEDDWDEGQFADHIRTEDTPPCVEAAPAPEPSAGGNISSTRPADTSEAASQTTADDTDLDSFKDSRQLSESQRSHTSRDSAGVGEPGEQAMAMDTASQTTSVAVDATDQSSRRQRTRSWADEYGSDDDEAETFVPSGASLPTIFEEPGSSSAGQSSYKMPVATAAAPGPPRPRRPPPPGPPPPAQSDSRPRHVGPARPVGPPPPMPPPAGPPVVLARGPPPGQPVPAAVEPERALAVATDAPASPVQAPAPSQPSVRSPKMSQEDPRQRSPKFSPHEDPVVHSPQFSRHEDPRARGPANTPQDPRQMPSHARHVDQQRPKAAAVQESYHHGFNQNKHPEQHRHERDLRHHGAREEGEQHRHERDLRHHGARDEGEQHRHERDLRHHGAREEGEPHRHERDLRHHGAREEGEPHRHERDLRHHGAREEGSRREHAGAPPPPLAEEAPRSRAPPARPSNGHAGGGQSHGCWGPAVAYTPAFAPRARPDRPMSESFANSGWKEKKLWTPPEAEKAEKPTRGNRAPGSSSGGGPRSRPMGDTAAPVGQGISGALESGKGGRSSEPGAPSRHDAAAAPAATEAPEPPARPRKKAPKPPKGSLEALDPDSSSADESVGPAPQLANPVSEGSVPKTVLVVNLNHRLKRLSGCCSLNQLTKLMKNFKEKNGLTLEAFVRSCPESFELEGRIIHLIENGQRWEPPEKAQRGEANREPPKKRGTGGQAEGAGSGRQKQGEGRGSEAASGGWAAGGGGGGGNTSWSSSSWSDWQAGGWQSDQGWHW